MGRKQTCQADGLTYTERRPVLPTEAVDGGNPTLVADLVTHKRDADEPFVPDALEERARDAIVEQFNALDTLPDPDKTGYRDALDDWMRKVRT